MSCVVSLVIKRLVAALIVKVNYKWAANLITKRLSANHGLCAAANMQMDGLFANSWRKAPAYTSCKRLVCT